METYCLRAIRNGDQSTKKEPVQKVQRIWKSEGYVKDKEKLELFLVLRNGEKDFPRYVNILVELISNCYIKILPASLTLLLEAYVLYTVFHFVSSEVNLTFHCYAATYKVLNNL